MALLQKEERVVVIGESSLPQTCVKKDEQALVDLFQCRIYLPLPTHSDRQVSPAADIWPCAVRKQLLKYWRLSYVHRQYGRTCTFCTM